MKRLFWGKAVIRDGRPVELLPLSSHCVDVAHVFRRLTELPVFRARLQTAAGATLEPAQLDRLAVLSLLHDLGKANLGFQNKIFSNAAPQVGHIAPLRGLILHFGEQLQSALDVDILNGWFDSGNALSAFLVAAWSHHGVPIVIDPSELAGSQSDLKWWTSDGDRDPLVAIRELMVAARNNFPGAFAQDVRPIPSSPALQHRFAGMVMLADWLGSHQAFFPVSRSSSFRSEEAARKIIAVVGLDSASARESLQRGPASFEARFGFAVAQPLQRAIVGLPADSASNRILIAEAETGSGKTEAALCRFFDLLAAGEVDGMYFALPTRVAAVELHGRVARYIERVFSCEGMPPLVVLAVPGYAFKEHVLAEMCLPDSGTRWIDWMEDERRERLWAAEHPKRFLAAPVAIGTIDQALLSSIRTKHAHLRSVCLDRSLLVVDEVHASDVYMRQLLRCLLDHHLSIGGHALLLSATLGSVARCEFVSGLGKADVPDFEEASKAAYPSITDRSGNVQKVCRHSESRTAKKVSFEVRPLIERPSECIPAISEALASGCRVLVILNTVARATSLLRAAESCSSITYDMLFSCSGVVAPHHGRFAPKDRELLDRLVSNRLGKGTPPGPVLLIGTQTLEQSLDIDADFLVTDLCPMDVLLQRVGRLHRHERQRPTGYEKARCVVMVPEEGTLEPWLTEDGGVTPRAKRCGLGSVYEDMRCLELTLKLLQSRSDVSLPEDNRVLVEGVTHPQRLASLSSSRMQQHGIQIEGEGLAQKTAAWYSSLTGLYEKDFNTFRFNEVGERARTRLGLDSLQVALERETESPFGVVIDEIVIPGHLAPKGESSDWAQVRIDAQEEAKIQLRLGDKRYIYSRFGLEPYDG